MEGGEGVGTGWRMRRENLHWPRSRPRCDPDCASGYLLISSACFPSINGCNVLRGVCCIPTEQCVALHRPLGVVSKSASL